MSVHWLNPCRIGAELPYGTFVTSPLQHGTCASLTRYCKAIKAFTHQTRHDKHLIGAVELSITLLSWADHSLRGFRFPSCTDLQGMKQSRLNKETVHSGYHVFPTFIGLAGEQEKILEVCFHCHKKQIEVY